jgi:hypothetical protein
MYLALNDEKHALGSCSSHDTWIFDDLRRLAREICEEPESKDGVKVIDIAIAVIQRQRIELLHKRRQYRAGTGNQTEWDFRGSE